MGMCLNTFREKGIHSLQVPLHQFFQNSYSIINYFLFLCSTFDLFLGTIFFLFGMNFVLLAITKSKKYLPISHGKINYQSFSACIIIYQLIQGQYAHSNKPPDKEFRKRASVQYESISKLQNCAQMKYL